MRKARLLFSLLLGAALLPLLARAASLVPPIVTNLVSVQRPGTFFVDITYDLIDPDSQSLYVLVEASSTGGASYLVPIVTLTGDVGLVRPGAGKRIVWNVWNDWAGNYTTNAKVRLLADDTQSVSPPPTNAVLTNLVWIPSGSFNMSGTLVYLSRGFYMGKYEVTQTEYQSLMATNPSNYKGSTLPVVSVAWFEATNYCARLIDRERTAGRLSAGWVYRLPTEAEWEYACRAGTTTTYSFGDSATNLSMYAWYSDNAALGPQDVGRKALNRWSLHDMHGNVREWCQDWYGDLPSGNVTDPPGPSSGSSRVLRGGAWAYSAGAVTSAYRIGGVPSNRSSTVGFRVVLVPDQ
jgi:formylglycine-generating enzyme required for sulfatase activity